MKSLLLSPLTLLACAAIGTPSSIAGLAAYGATPLSPLSDPFNGALKRPSQKANVI